MERQDNWRLKGNVVAMVIYVISVFLLCYPRIELERKNDRVTVVMTRTDIELLAESADMGADEYLSRVRSNNTAGLPLIIEPGSFDNELSLLLLDDETVLELPDGIEFGPYLTEHGATMGLVEDDAQYSFVPIPDFEPVDQYMRWSSEERAFVLSPAFVPMVRVFKLFPDIAARYAVLGYEGAEELVNIFCRAIVDRSIRVVWLTPYTHSETGALISDPAEYGETIERMSERLKKAGLTLGGEIFVYENYAQNQSMLWALCLIVLLSGLELLADAFGINEAVRKMIFYAYALVNAVAFVLVPELALGANALGASILYPCLAMCAFAERLSSSEDGGMANTVQALFFPILISVYGGLIVGVLQSSTRYLLAIDNFRGVKVSQALPLIFAVFFVVQRLCGGIGGMIEEFKSGRKLYGIGAGVLILIGAVYFILRTGDGFVQTPVLEQRFRNVLETNLAIRPRTKEFMIAWPCMLIAYTLYKGGVGRHAWPFVIVAMTGFSSIVNTFCHSRAHMIVSGIRTVYGLIFGLAIGIPLSLIIKRVLNGRRTS